MLGKPKLLKCLKCLKYTMREKCVDCGLETVSVEPPRFSPKDKYGKQRRKALYGLE